jgi:hypothetical protein
MFVRYNLQRETQPWVVGLWWRNGERQVPYPSTLSAPNRSDSGTISLTHVFDPTLTSETIFGTTYINFPNTIDDRSKVSRDALGYPYQGVFGESNDQIPSADMGSGGPMYFNPGGSIPFSSPKWQFNFAEPHQVWESRRQARLLFRADHEQPARQWQQQWPSGEPVRSNSTGTASRTFSRRVNSQRADQNVLLASPGTASSHAQDTWKVKPNHAQLRRPRSSIAPGKTVRAGGRGSIGPAAAPGTTFPGIVYHALDSASLRRRQISPSSRASVRLGSEGHRRDVIRGRDLLLT